MVWVDLFFCISFLLLTFGCYTLLHDSQSKFERNIIILFIIVSFIMAVNDCIKFLRGIF